MKSRRVMRGVPEDILIVENLLSPWGDSWETFDLRGSTLKVSMNVSQILEAIFPPRLKV